MDLDLAQVLGGFFVGVIYPFLQRKFPMLPALPLPGPKSPTPEPEPLPAPTPQPVPTPSLKDQVLEQIRTELPAIVAAEVAKRLPGTT